MKLKQKAVFTTQILWDWEELRVRQCDSPFVQSLIHFLDFHGQRLSPSKAKVRVVRFRTFHFGKVFQNWRDNGQIGRCDLSLLVESDCRATNVDTTFRRSWFRRFHGFPVNVERRRGTSESWRRVANPFCRRHHVRRRPDVSRRLLVRRFCWKRRREISRCHESRMTKQIRAVRPICLSCRTWRKCK